MVERRRVMVTGAAVLAGGVADLSGFDAMLRASRPCMEAPEWDWDGWLGGAEPAMAARARRVARTASPALRSSIRVSVDAMRSAALPDLGVVVAGSNLALGRGYQAFEKFKAEPAFLSPRHGYEFYDTHVMASIAEILGARGPGMTVGGASGSGNVAIGVALDLVRHGRTDACLVVGPMPDLSPVERHALRTMGALAEPDSPCRPFDRAAHGFVPGDACAAVLLETEASARQRGAPVMAEIAGACWVQGANHLPSPDLDSEIRAMTGALADAGMSVDSLDLVSAHATGTLAGDAVECEALRAVLGHRAAQIPVNAPKSLFGHALHAAGVVELVAAIRQVQGGFVHGTAGLTDLIADDLHLVGPETIDRPVRVVLSNSFGFGSIAASILVRDPEWVQ